MTEQLTFSLSETIHMTKKKNLRLDSKYIRHLNFPNIRLLIISTVNYILSYFLPSITVSFILDIPTSLIKMSPQIKSDILPTP